MRLTETFDVRDFMLAMDVLLDTKKSSAALKLARAAAAADSRRSSDVLRNLARALEKSGDIPAARPVYYAAIAASGTDERAIVWCSEILDRVKDREDLLLLSKAAVFRDKLSAALWSNVGIKLHNDNNRGAAKIWLERAVMLSPDELRFRHALATNVGALEGRTKAIAVLGKDYVPNPDYQSCVIEVDESHKELIRRIILAGRVEDNGVVLFDPLMLPQWISETYPDLVGSTGESH